MEDSIKVLALCKRLFLEVLVHLLMEEKQFGGNSHGRLTRNKEAARESELFFLWKGCFSVLMYSTVPLWCGLKDNSTQTCDSQKCIPSCNFSSGFWGKNLTWNLSNLKNNFGPSIVSYFDFFCQRESGKLIFSLDRCHSISGDASLSQMCWGSDTHYYYKKGWQFFAHVTQPT